MTLEYASTIDGVKYEEEEYEDEYYGPEEDTGEDTNVEDWS